MVKKLCSLLMAMAVMASAPTLVGSDGTKSGETSPRAKKSPRHTVALDGTAASSIEFQEDSSSRPGSNATLKRRPSSEQLAPLEAASAAPFGDTVCVELPPPATHNSSERSSAKNSPRPFEKGRPLEVVTMLTPESLIEQVADQYLCSIEDRDEALFAARRIMDDLNSIDFQTRQEAMDYIAGNYLSYVDPELAQDLAYRIIVTLLGEANDGDDEEEEGSSSSSSSHDSVIGNMTREEFADFMWQCSTPGRIAAQCKHALNRGRDVAGRCTGALRKAGRRAVGDAPKAFVIAAMIHLAQHPELLMGVPQ